MKHFPFEHVVVPYGMQSRVLEHGNESTQSALVLQTPCPMEPVPMPPGSGAHSIVLPLQKGKSVASSRTEKRCIWERQLVS